MVERIVLDMLSETSVSVKTQKYIVEDGIEYPVGDPHRKAYINSEQGRIELMTELSEQDAAAVLTKWGSAPTVFPRED